MKTQSPNNMKPLVRLAAHTASVISDDVHTAQGPREVQAQRGHEPMQMRDAVPPLQHLIAAVHKEEFRQNQHVHKIRVRQGR